MLLLVAGATVWGLVGLWPDGSDVASVADRAMYVAEGATFERGEVLRVEAGCDTGVGSGAGAGSRSEAGSGRGAGAEAGGESAAADAPSAALAPGSEASGASCLRVGVGLRSGPDAGRFIDVQLRGALAGAGIRPGDHLELLAYPLASAPTQDAPDLNAPEQDPAALGSADPAASEPDASDPASAESLPTPPGGSDPASAEPSGADPALSATYGIARGYDTTGVFRGWQLLVLVLVFAAVVVMVGRWRGLLALAALGVAAWVLLAFVLPALVAGGPGVLIGIVGSSAIMFATLYFVHGPNLRTTAALVGTLCGILIMAGISLIAVQATRLSGVGDEASGQLAGLASQIDFRGLLSCAIIIAGLGVLNDVTITQASAVWELRAAAPAMSRREVYARAMRIGRDHIASTVYTVFFAYVGAAMSVLILLYLYNRPVLSLLTHEDIVTEIVRTLCGSVGLVLAVPITTWVAAVLLPPAEDRPALRHRRSARADDRPAPGDRLSA